ncbi:hypothetical protein EVAR_11040_1 [Eumeta japonica]|uniref:Uncharacterized protein n=1 Tax=Eumeta variegata TaxID=151549 RepID=A0A4C1U3Z0_EUMVA|nr:hypothetical protein EVAR_11040_1 [Eumeta japonica]
MGQRVIGLRAGQYLREDLESLKMLTSPSLPFFTLRIAFAARPSPPERPCRRDRVVASVPRLLPSRHSVRAAPTLPSMRLPSVKCAARRRRDGPPSGVEVLDALVPPGTCAGHFPHSDVLREQPREDERGMQGHCTVSPACLQSDAALDSVEHLSHAELPRRRCPSARSVQNDRLYHAFVYGQTEAYFANRANPLAIHVHHWVVIFQLLVSTIEFVFDGANLSLFLTPQQCTRARARLASSIDEADCPENMRTTSSANACTYTPSSPSSRVGNPGSGSKAYLTTTSRSRGSLGPGHGGSPGSQGRAAGSQRRPPRVVEGALYVQ